MNIEYTWRVMDVTTIPEKDGHKNVVTRIIGTCIARDHTYQSGHAIVCEFDKIGNTFVEYSDLTEEILLQWCFNSKINKNEIELEAKNKLLANNAPKCGILPPNWRPLR